MKKVLIVAGVLATLMAGSAAAQVPADRSVKYRQSALTVMATSWGRVNAVAKGEAKLEPAALTMNADALELMSKMAFDGFIQGTPQPGDGKGAKPEIWKEWDKFKKMQGDLQAATAKLDAAAKSGNMDALKAAAGETGKACGACHDAFRFK